MAEKKAKKSALKPAAAKKAAAPKKVAETAKAKKAAPKAAAKSLGGLTRIVVKKDAGWGNSLYIRGNGAGLNWQKGVLLQCVDSDEWLWENKVAKGSVEFKILVNDQFWADGENLIILAGETLTCYPTFCGA
ncbi:MAG: hypothetical protein J6T16_08110 [Opitutales bacterium]|nr:hypothetical protein [Opitutales bacterium]